MVVHSGLIVVGTSAFMVVQALLVASGGEIEWGWQDLVRAMVAKSSEERWRLAKLSNHRDLRGTWNYEREEIG